MKLKFAIGAAALAGVLGGCVIISTDEDVSSSFEGSREPLYGSLVTASDTVVITAPSNGCTQKDSFRADTDRDDGVYRITFDRVRPDHCKALVPDGVELTWSFAELGVPAAAKVVVGHYSRR